MVLLEMNKEDFDYARKIGELAEMSILVDEQKSFSSDLNDIVQLGVVLTPYVIPSVTLIIVEMIKASKKVKIKLSDDSIEIEGMPIDKMLEIIEIYIKEKNEDAAKKMLNKILIQDKN